MKTRKENRSSFVLALTIALLMATMLMACSSTAAPTEETKETEAAVETEENVEVAEIKEADPTPEPTAEPTPEPTAEPTPEPIVYEGIDVNSSLPGAEWAETFNGIIDEPKYFIYNDSTNKKVIVENGQEVEFEDNDSLGLFMPEGEGLADWIDKNHVFQTADLGRPTIFTEIRERYKEDEFVVMESDVTSNGKAYTLTATLILK